MFINYHQRSNKVAEAKVLAWLFWLIWTPLAGYTLYVNIETWKSDVLFLIVLIGFGVRTYFYIKLKNQLIKKTEQDIRMKEIEIEKHKKTLL